MQLEAGQKTQDAFLPQFSDVWLQCVTPVCFWPIQNLAESAWLEHAPFAFWLTAAVRPRSFVELGTHNGFSYMAFCQAVQRLGLSTACYAVDTWQGDEHAGFYGEEVYARVAELNDRHYSSFSSLMRCRFEDAQPFFADGSIDLLHIDGRHRYEDVKGDFESWQAKLSGRGVVLFHDTNVRERNFGVWRLWSEISQHHPSLEFTHGHGLGVLAMGPEIPEGLRPLLTAGVDQLDAIRAAYAHLGHAISRQWQLEIASRRLGDTQEELARLRVDTQEELARLRVDSQEELARLRVDSQEELARLRLGKTELQQSMSSAAAQVAVLRGRQVQAREKFEKEILRLRASASDAQGHIQHLQARFDDVQARLFAIEHSEAWRVTAPLRALGSRMWAVSRAARRGAELIWRDKTKAKTPAQPASAPEILGVSPPPSLPLSPSHRYELVDIVICIHNALEDVRRCLKSVICNTLPPYRLILVDDGSGPPTRDFLDEFAPAHGAMLIRHEAAQGYTFAANAGLRATDAPYIVLLNSDSEVTDGWLDRMVDHCRRDPGLGIVGPLSNCASWQSVPQLMEDGDWSENALPGSYGPDDMARVVAEVSRRRGVPIGFVNGFCLLVRRAVLDEVGLYDEKTFHAGYGEENDFCIRVRNKGWKLIVADDAYVFHRQSRSYGHNRRLALAKKADEMLAAKHDPSQHIVPFVHRARDSLLLQHTRRRIQAALLCERLAEEGRRSFEGSRVAFILPVAESGGGANVVVQEAIAARAFGVDAWIINDRANEARFRANYPNLELPVLFGPSEDMAGFVSDAVRDLSLDAVIATVWHSFFGLPAAGSHVRRPALGYYIQDLETEFFDISGVQQAVLATYVHRPEIIRVTKSRWNCDAVTQIGGITPSIIGPSVDLARFGPSSDQGLDSGTPVHVAAMVRPSTPRRNPTTTLRVLRSLKDTFGAGTIVSCFGANSSELAAMAIPLDGIRCLGHLNAAQVATVLAETDVFLDFSIWQAMGLTALEAMASGAAVTVPQRGGAPEFCENGVSALILDNTTDPTACYNAARRLIVEAELRLALRLSGLEVACAYPPELASLRLLQAILAR